MPTNAPQTRHAVTAIIVAHDGARLLPGLVQALRAQTHPIEQTVGVDTASRDRSGAVLAELIGQDAVFGMNRSTGYGEAVATALKHAARRRSGMTDPNLARVEWIWLLHDDCEPAPDALEKLLRAAGRDRTVVVVGPKVLDGQDRRTLREVGIAIDRAGRRVTGIDPGEIDQGQHDHKRQVLAVGSAGMLVRRDVWDRLGGFDPNLKLFRDDLDFCWRVQAAGYRVQVATDAIVYHWELAGRRRRAAEFGSARVLDRRNALYVLAVNLPLLPMLRIVGGCVAGSLTRAAYFLLTKQPDLAAAFALSVLALFAHPVRLFKGRRSRARGLAEGYSAVRTFIPPARTLVKLAERTAALIGNGPPQASSGRHQATTEESDEDIQFVDQVSVVRRIIGHPGFQLFVVLLVVSLIATRRLLGTSPLGGGALVPAWGGAGALWQEYLTGFHAVSVGSSASAPPYLAVVAAFATVLGGQAWLAVDLLLLGCVPLAGITAYTATRWIVTATPARLLLAAAYALLPVATGAVAAGRLGTAVAFVLLPLIAVSAGRMLTAAPRQARRAAWATGLLVALAAAFAPFTWVLAVLLGVATVGLRRRVITADPVNAAIVVVTPFFVLFPWSLHLLSGPSAFLTEAGLSAPGLTTHGLSATALLALSPGGPGVPPSWVTIGFALCLVALVLPPRRTALVLGGWATAVTGLLAAVVLSRVSVTSSAGAPANAWPGVALAVAALGLLVAAAPLAERLSASLATPALGRSRRLLAGLVLVAAGTAPLFVAVYWVASGVRGPVGSVSTPVLPAFVTASSTSGAQYRTLILRPHGAGGDSQGLDYQVVRQGDPALGEPELGIPAAAQAALSRQVAALGTPDGADAGDPGLVLGSFGIRWVMLPAPVDATLASRLDTALGLAALNKGPSYDLWEVTGPVGRVRVVAPTGATTVLASGTQDLAGAAAPASGGTLLLAEPYGGWTARLNGQALKPVATPVAGWAQGFVLPPGGGQLSVTRDNLARPLALIAEAIATLAVIVLALPGKRTDPAEEAEALAALREAGDSRGHRAGSRAAVGAGGLARGFGLGRKLRLGRPVGPDVGQDTVGGGDTADGPHEVGPDGQSSVPESPALGSLTLESQPSAADAARDADLARFAAANDTAAATVLNRASGAHRRPATREDAADRPAAAASGTNSLGNAGGASAGSSAPPWDMAGDWNPSTGSEQAERAGQQRSAPQRPAPDPAADPARLHAESARWGTDSLDLGRPTPDMAAQSDEDWLEALLRDAGTKRNPPADASQPDAASPAPASPAPASPPWGTESLNLPTPPERDSREQPSTERASGWRDAPDEPAASSTGLSHSAERPAAASQGAGQGGSGWSTDPLDTSKPLPGPADSSPRKTTGWRNALSRLTGQQPALPTTAAPRSATPEPSRRESPALGTPMPGSQPPGSPQSDAPAPEEPAASVSRPPWELELEERAPWDTAPAAPPPATGAHPRPAPATGEHPAMPERAVPEPPAPTFSPHEPSRPQSPVLGTPLPHAARHEPAPSRDSGPQRAQRESGRPEDASPAWRTEARSAWGTGALPTVRTESQPASGPGAQPGAWTGAEPGSRNPARSARGTGAQPTFTPTGPQPTFTPTGPQPTFTPTGPQPTFTPTGSHPAFTPTGSHPAFSSSGVQPTFTPADNTPADNAHPAPVSSSGAQPVQRVPWESGDWGQPANFEGGDRDGSRPQRAIGAGEQAQAPDATQGGREARPTEPERSERPTHRGGKHGKPSRWRGSGGRSSEDGES